METEANRDALVRFVTNLRNFALSPTSKRVRINFDRTEWMTAPGTLFFAAELDRINALSRNRVCAKWPKSDRVAQVLQHVGIFEKLGVRRLVNITRNDVRYWKVDTGSEVLGERASEALEIYNRLFPGRKQTLYRGLTEAMTNTKHHAYEGERGDGYPNVLPNWWMFSEVREGRLQVAFCDLGIGIPRSLPMSRDRFRSIKRLLRREHMADHDGNRIQGSITVGASRTRQDHRGKGLREIRSVLEGLQGTMHIHSNSGYYLYDATKKRERSADFGPSRSIMGTVILWQIPVEQAAS